MSRVDELLDHARARVHNSEVPFHLHPAAEQRRLRKQFVAVVVVCSSVMIALGIPTDSTSPSSISPSLGQEQMLALLQEGAAK